MREQKANVRIIAATNKPLEQMVKEGKFRSDLFFRLRIVHLRVPPLRERGADIALLAKHYLALHGAHYRKPDLRFTPEQRVVVIGLRPRRASLLDDERWISPKMRNGADNRRREASYAAA